MQDRDRQPIEEVYTIKQVVELSGVPDNTIRSWERRYGVPLPVRSGGNQRRYSIADLEAICSIQASRVRGRTMEQALQELRPHPSLLKHVGVSPELDVSSPKSPGKLGGDSGHRMLAALTRIDGDAARQVLAGATWSTTVEDASELLLAVLDRLRHLRTEGRLTNVQARYGKEWIFRKLQSALDDSDPEHGRATMIVAGMHDDAGHSRSLWFATMLSRAGYRVACLESEATNDDVLELIERTNPVALVLVVQSRHAELSALATYARLMAERVPSAWRGPVFAAKAGDLPVGTIPTLPTNPTAALVQLESALRTEVPSLSLMRRP